jgi:hypothetical protein
MMMCLICLLWVQEHSSQAMVCACLRHHRGCTWPCLYHGYHGIANGYHGIANGYQQPQGQGSLSARPCVFHPATNCVDCFPTAPVSCGCVCCLPNKLCRCWVCSVDTAACSVSTGDTNPFSHVATRSRSACPRAVKLSRALGHRPISGFVCPDRSHAGVIIV